MVYVTTPPAVPWQHGLLDAVQVIDFTDPHTFHEVVMEPICGSVYATPAECTVRPDTKDPVDGIESVYGTPFALYHLATCRLIGSLADAQTRAQQGFDLAERIGIEEAFADFFTTLSVTDVGTFATPEEALAAIEQFAAANYGGTPIIHLDRSTATLLLGQSLLVVVNGQLQTHLGTPVAAGGGYGMGAHIWVTGPATVWRNGHVFNEIGYDLPENTYAVLVERNYQVAASCLAGDATYTAPVITVPTPVAETAIA